MWLAGNDGLRLPRSRADVYLGRRRALLRVAGRHEHSHQGEDLAASLAWLRQRLREAVDDRVAGRSRLTSVRVQLSASLSRPVLVEPVQGDMNAMDRARAARAMATTRAGLMGPCSVWLDRDEDRAPRMAVVVERIVLDQLNAIAAEHRLRLESIRPWWAEVLNETLVSRPGLQALAAWEEDVLTLLAGASSSISMARSMTGIPDEAAAKAAFLRMCMAESIDPAQCLAVALDLKATAEAGGSSAFGKVALA